MGLFDTVHAGNGRKAQVDAWGLALRDYHPGDRVPDVDGHDSYSLDLKPHGTGYAIVVNNTYVSWMDKPLKGVPVVGGDEFRSPSDPTPDGLMPEDRYEIPQEDWPSWWGYWMRTDDGEDPEDEAPGT